MITMPYLDDDIAGALAQRHGLARVRLFDDGTGPAGSHDVLLDGPYGSFAVSTTDEPIPHWEAASWAWSSDVAHHVVVTQGMVTARRWDQPSQARSYTLKEAMRSPGAFYEDMRRDRAGEARGIVAQSLTLFRNVRVVVRQRGGTDEQAVIAYLHALALLAATDERINSSLPIIPHLPGHDPDVGPALGDLQSAMSGFAWAEMDGLRLRAWASLSLRHASGTIFQEAHHILVSVPEPNLFGYVDPLPAKVRRGGVHFTPPTLARSLAEQALAGLGELGTRRSITIADYTCGSGAFLVECIRALDRAGFKGETSVVGRDISLRAVLMADFVLRRTMEGLDGKLPYRVDVKVGDALLDELPEADLVVLNPPFAAWNDMKGENRALVREIVPEASRPDLGMAFVTRALSCLRKGGALAAILPARVLEGATNRGWREELSQAHTISFVATFDDLSLFRNAIVRIGAMVCTLGRAAEGTLVLRAGQGAGSTADALRGLRKGELTGDADIARSGWSLDRVEGGLDRVPRIRSLAQRGSLVNEVPTATTRPGPGTTVADLFEVYQGVRSGANESFVLSRDEWLALPANERRWFRKTVTSKGISAGRVIEHVYLFYPYDGIRTALRTEAEVRDAVPAYFSRYLAPFKPGLMERARPGPGRWWLLGERRPRLSAEAPLIVSKYFAGPQGFALDVEGAGMLLQGFAWFPKPSLAQALGRVAGEGVPAVAKAYLAILNSDTFTKLVEDAYPPMLGGQRDMSKRYMDPLPLPDLSGKHRGLAVTILAAYSEAVYLGRASTRDTPFKDTVEGLVRDLLAGTDSEMPPAKAEPPGVPGWAQALFDAGMSEDTHEIGVAALDAMYDLALREDVRDIELVFERADVTGLAGITLITLLRGSAPFEHMLSGWQPFRDKVKAEFQRRGRSVEKVMRGLL